MITKFKWADHKEWLEIRNKYIGGSDAGAVVGFNPYKGKYALWMEKTGKAEPFGGSIATEVGTRLEGFVAELFERETGKKVRKDNHTLVNDLYPWACANVDRRIVGENALLECKTTASLPNLRKFKNGEYPETWYCQMTHYMAVTGADRVYLAVLISNREFKWFTLERDDDEIAALMDAEKAFWDCVLEDTPPEPDSADAEAVNDMYPAANAQDTYIDLTADADLITEYNEAKADADTANDRLQAIKNRICALLGDNSEGGTDNWKVTWKATASSRFDAKAFRAARPDIDLSPYYKNSVSRRFDIKKKG